MADTLNFNVEIRERTGKGGAREARRNGKVPGVLYGGGEDPVAVNLKLNEVIKGINSGHFLTSTANLVHDGKKQLVIPQAIQLDPVSDMPLHVDLYRVKASQVIAVEVPVHFTNEEEAPGLKKGGSLNIVRFAVELNVRADSIPEALEADLTGLDVGDNVKISDITLPKGAEPTITDRDFTIATIAAPAAVISAEQEAEAAEKAEAAEGEESEGQDEEKSSDKED